MKRLLIVALILLFASPAWGATYYMRADGSATVANAEVGAGGSCSAAANAMSYATMAAGSFSAGDTINLCDTGGVFYYATYSSSFVPPSSGSEVGGYITYQAAPGHAPILDFSADVLGTAGSWTEGANGIWYRSLGTALSISVVWFNSLPGLHVANATSPANLGEWYNDTSAQRLYVYSGVGVNPTTAYSTMRKSLAERGIVVDTKRYLRFTGLTIRNQIMISAAPSAKGAIYITGSDHITIDNCTIQDIQEAIVSQNSSQITIGGTSASQGNHIRRVYYSSTATDDANAIVFDSNSTLVEYNDIDNQYSLYNGTLIEYSGNGIMLSVTDGHTEGSKRYAQNAVVSHNTTRHPYNYGINISNNDASCPAGLSVGAIIEHNDVGHGRVVGGVDTDGLSVGGDRGASNYAADVIFRFNRVDSHGNSCGQTANYWRNITWLANIFSNCGTSSAGWGGLRIKAYDKAYNNTIYNVYGNGIGYDEGADIQNNIISGVSLSGGAQGYGVRSWSGSGTGYNNLLYGCATAATYNFTNTSGVTSDPLLNADYTLTPASPAVRAGVNLGATYDADYAGHSRASCGALWSIGAYEWCPATAIKGSVAGTFSGNVK